jgi:tRNA threonylcarbamoyladenosine biosynthesis protein TsaB
VNNGALEFSSEQRSVAVLETSTATVLGFASETGGREMKALGMVQSALDQSGCTKEELAALAVGLGPGSYTGIRAAISLAQGWQLARGIKLLGISSAEVLAKSAQLQGIFGPVELIIDAQRNEFYTAGYAISTQSVQELEPLKLVPAAEIKLIAEGGSTLAGPDATSFAGAKRVYPDARALALLAIDRTHYVAGAELTPIYLREASFVKAPPPRVIPE